MTANVPPAKTARARRRGGPGRPRPLSLRLRLLVGIAMLVALIVALGTALVVASAPRKVETEVIAATAATAALFRSVLAALANSPRAADEAEALVRAMGEVRHVRVSLLDASGARRVGGPAPDAEAEPVPAWFAGLVDVRERVTMLPVMEGGDRVGTVVVETDPRKELLESWEEVRADLVALTLIALGAGALVYSVTGQALRPLDTLVAAMRRVESGDYAARVPEIAAPEIARLGLTFNAMADRLAAMAADNRRMAERLVTLQEEERAELARDLHDDIGPSLFAANLDAAAIERAARAAGDTELAARARSILEVVAHIQGQVRAMLGRLKPSGLDEFGLGAAIQGLAEFWRRRHPEVEWRLSLPADDESFGRTVDVTAFRIVQECALNAMRHGGARRIAVALAAGPGAAGTRELSVTVADDGGGLDENTRAGYGLSGMAERVGALGGTLDLESRPGEGLTVSARLPVGTEGRHHGRAA